MTIETPVFLSRNFYNFRSWFRILRPPWITTRKVGISSAITLFCTELLLTLLSDAGFEEQEEREEERTEEKIINEGKKG